MSKVWRDFLWTFLWLQVSKVMPRGYEAFSIFHTHDTAFSRKTSARNGGGLIQCCMPTRPDQDLQISASRVGKSAYVKRPFQGFNRFTSCTYSNFWPKHGLRSNFRAPKFKIFSWGTMPPHPPKFCMCAHALLINTWSYQSKIAASGHAKWYIIVYIFAVHSSYLTYVW